MSLYGEMMRAMNGKSKPREIPEKQKKGLDEIYEMLDYTLDEYRAKDFIEIVGRTGGDTRTFRVYEDGSVYER